MLKLLTDDGRSALAKEMKMPLYNATTLSTEEKSKRSKIKRLTLPKKTKKPTKPTETIGYMIPVRTASRMNAASVISVQMSNELQLL